MELLVKRFSDFGIKAEHKSFVGDKVKIHKILNTEIKVHAYHIKPSKYPKNGNDNCLWIQISIGETKFVIFSVAKVLIETIQKVNESDFPFLTKIVSNNDRYEFT